MSKYLIPVIFILIIIYGKIKRVKLYDAFTCGAQKGFNLAFEILPFILSIMLAVELFRVSNLSVALTKGLSPIFSLLGMPCEVVELVVLKPFTGSGSVALLSDIFCNYGVDSYVARCACAIMASSETTFYIATVYMSKCKVKKLSYAIPVSLLVSFVGAIIACLLCKIM